MRSRRARTGLAVVLSLLTTMLTLAADAGAQSPESLVARSAGSRDQLRDGPGIDWPTFHFDDARTGENPYETVLDPSNVRDLELAWAFDTGSPVGSSPAVVDGVVYVAGDGYGIDTDLYALHEEDGRLRWLRPGLSGSPAADITVANGRLYLGIKSSYWPRATVVFDTAWGDTLWYRYFISQTPTVADGIVYNSDSFYGLRAIDVHTRRLHWSRKAGRTGYGSAAAVVDGILYTGAYDKRVYAYDALTGRVVWTAMTGGNIKGSPAVVDGVVYVGSLDGYLYALHADTGTVVWKALTGAGVTTSPAVAEGIVYVASDDANLYAFDASTGDLVWQTPAHLTKGQDPVVANGVVYEGSNRGVYAYDALTGEVLATLDTGTSEDANDVIVVNATVYVGSDNGYLYAFRLPAGGPATR